MKKIILLISLVTIMTLFVGCNTSSYVATDKKSNFAININNVEITMHKEASKIIEALGTSKEYFESESCAFPGLDKVYTYNSFEISTYPKNNVDYISGVFLLDDTVSTKEGVYLYQSIEDMKRAYGENYKEANGVYTYTKGKSQISFMIKEDKIIQIEYLALQ